MRRRTTGSRSLCVHACGALLLAGAGGAHEASAAGPRATTSSGVPRTQAPAFEITRTDEARGTVRMLRAPHGRTPYVSNGAPQAAALRFVADHASAFGLADASNLTATSAPVDALGHTRVDLAQRHNDRRVFGAAARVHFGPDGDLTAAQANVVPSAALDHVAADPTLSAAEAGSQASAHVAAQAGAAAAVRSTELLVFDIGLLDKRGPRPALAYAIELRGPDHASTVFVSATSGAVLLVNNHIHDEMQRVAYDGDYGPGFLVWQESDGVYTGGDSDVEALLDYTQDTYTLFANVSMGDYLSYDGDSAPMEGVVDAPLECPNAQWDGTSTNYCPGLVTDDVVAHEWAHAYTQETQGLVYAYQPGALNEAYSDMFGEAVDLLNGVGQDEPSGPRAPGDCSGGGDSVRWLIGEETQGLGGAIRDMWAPRCFGDPAVVGDGDYVCTGGGFFDNGGVHINSGVPNHAFALLVDGGLEEGVTVPAIGMTRALAIYWRAMSTYQTQVSGFAEHADALAAACEDLRMAGTVLLDPMTGVSTGDTIRPQDCAAVAQAIEVTNLDGAAPCGTGTLLDTAEPAASCAAGDEAVQVLEERFETDLGTWQLEHLGATDTFTPRDWVHATVLPSGRAGAAAFATNDLLLGNTVDDNQAGVMRLTSPSFQRPEATRVVLSFRHWLASEPGQDGGNLKLSVNGGDFELIPIESFVFNAYNAALEPSSNPLGGDPAFTGSDVGLATGSWATSTVDLTDLAQAGDELTLRFDFGVDRSNGLFGWYVDDVVVEACGADRGVGETGDTEGNDTEQATTDDSSDPTAVDGSSSGPDEGGTAGPQASTSGPDGTSTGEGTDTEPQATGENGGGCGCTTRRTSPGAGGGALGLFALLGLLHRRRRRRLANR